MLVLEILGGRFNQDLAPIGIAAVIGYVVRTVIVGDAYPFWPGASMGGRWSGIRVYIARLPWLQMEISLNVWFTICMRSRGQLLPQRVGRGRREAGCSWRRGAMSSGLVAASFLTCRGSIGKLGNLPPQGCQLTARASASFSRLIHSWILAAGIPSGLTSSLGLPCRAF